MQSESAVMSDFSQLQLADAVVSARGAKSCTLTDGSAKYILTVGARDNLLTTPFGACSFGEEPTQRKSLELRLPPQWTEYFQKFDAWAVTYLAEHSERLFKKVLTAEQVKEMYKPCVSQRGSYPATLRTKATLGGSAAVRCWDALDQRMPVPEDWRNFELLPRVHISHLWQMSRECGFVLNVLDCRCLEQSSECPF
jgi:hypothetical protein